MLNLEDLKYDLIVFESFSSHLFDRTDSEIVEMLGEMRRLASNGRSFVLTSESEMLSSRVNAYLRAMSDNVIIIKTEVNRDKIDRLLYIPKMNGRKPMDRLVKFTVEDNGIEIDTREFVG
jgi:archaellum biogenesis ATPase FlaH